MSRTLLALAVVAALFSPTLAQLNSTNVIVAFNNAAQDDVRSLGIQNQISTRYFSLVHLAQYLAITRAPSNATDAVKAGYAAFAAHAVLNTLAPWRINRHDAAIAPFVANLTTADRAAANATGSSIAAALVASRVDDGLAQYVPFTPAPANGPVGAYQFVVNQTYTLYPQLATTKTFVIVDPPAFDQGPPNAPGSGAYNSDLAEVFVVGSKNSTNRTAAQTETAYFWADGNTTSAISGHFNQIAQKVIPANTPLIDVARVFAQANVASFDASVAGWVVKYKYLNWRPVTAIRQGDGSPANAAYVNAAWTPELATPSHPEYASGHQYTAAAIAKVLATFLGTDAVSFTVGTEYPGLPPRNYTSIQQAVDEVGDSRVWGGIHFRQSVEAGSALGAAVADAVVKGWEGAVFVPKDGAGSGEAVKGAAGPP